MTKKQEAGMPMAGVRRRHGLIITLAYKFKAKSGGMHGRASRNDVPEVNVCGRHRFESLADENTKLKRLLADAMLDNVVLKDLLGKN
jgi:putative transposase